MNKTNKKVDSISQEEYSKSTRFMEYFKNNPVILDITRSIFHIIYISIFLFLLYILFISLFLPENLSEFIISKMHSIKECDFSDVENLTGLCIRVYTITLIIAVFSSGALAGLVRQIFKNLLSKKSENIPESDNWEYVDFWKIIYSILTSGFFAVLIFLLFKAGIIKNSKVDIFNPYGLVGVSILTGYFSDKLIDKFSFFYDNLLSSKKRNKSNLQENSKE